MITLNKMNSIKVINSRHITRDSQECIIIIHPLTISNSHLQLPLKFRNMSGSRTLACNI